MKKVFMSVAVVALMVAASACGNNAKKAETRHRGTGASTSSATGIVTQRPKPGRVPLGPKDSAPHLSSNP